LLEQTPVNEPLRERIRELIAADFSKAASQSESA
jgi:hypothetical protein